MKARGWSNMTMRFRLLSAALWTALILVLCWTPQRWLPVEERPGSWTQILRLDKVVHGGLFASFAVLWLRALPRLRNRHLWVGLAGTALAAATEVVQNVPIINREGEVQDAIADVAGVLIGFVVFPWIERRLNAMRPLVAPDRASGPPGSRVPGTEEHTS
jgi:VanZ family protein